MNPPNRRAPPSNVPNFGILNGSNNCTTIHTPGTPPDRFGAGLMQSTLQLSQSADKGCPWCAIYWEAVKRSVGVTKPGDQDFIYWRYGGESFFEPWVTIQGTVAGGGDYKIQIYTDINHANAVANNPFPVKSFLGGQTNNTDAAMQQIESWRQQCSNGHAQCPATPEAVDLPTRLIDVSVPKIAKVVETKGKKGQYICLSHRWGREEMPIKHTNATSDSLHGGIPNDSLPATFRDAATVARRMNCDYLWIDTLCIIQDDTNDWQREAAQMASIYKNGLLTLAAAWAGGARDGLFQTATASVVDQTPLDLARFVIPFPVYVRRQLQYEVGHLQRGQSHGILERGWILQERLLSSRVAYFGFNEVAWECMTGSACECEPTITNYRHTQYSPREPFNPKAAFSRSIAAAAQAQAPQQQQSPELWHHIVNAYTGLEFSYIKDKFPALAGLGSDIARRRPGDEYLAGLWQSTLISDLLWRKRKAGDWKATVWTQHYDLHNVFGGSDPGQQEFEDRLMRSEWKENRIRKDNRGNKLAPTWSWAAVHSQIEYDKELNVMDMDLLDLQTAELVSVNCTHNYGMGLLQTPDNTSITIRGKIVAAELRIIQGYPKEHRLYRNDRAMAFSDSDYGPWAFFNPLKAGMELFCLQLATGRWKTRPTMRRIYGLVLMKVEDETKGDVYERVGMFQETYKDGEEWCIFDGVDGVEDVVVL